MHGIVTFRHSVAIVTEAGGMAEAAKALGMMIDAGSVAASLSNGTPQEKYSG